MKKALAETIAALIPGRMARDRWRGILRYGLLPMLRMRRLVRRHSEIPPQTNIAVCAIAKDEAPYLAEWIDYHLSIGVDRIYLYDNGSTDNTAEILKPYVKKGVVEHIFFPGHRMQIAAYDDCITRHRLDTRWIAFIDIDEFIVPVADTDLPAALLRFTDAAALEINWLNYGSSGLKHYEPQPVMSRFRRHAVRSHPLNRYVKSIVDPRRTVTMTGCHQAATLPGNTTVDTHGERITVPYKRREPLHDILRINHYPVKSLEEFRAKQARGRASGRARNVPDDYFTRYDLNDIEG